MGWVLLDSTNLDLLASGVLFVEWPDTPERDRSPLWNAVHDLLNEHGIHADVIAYEDVVKHSSVWAAHLYGGQIGHIQWWAAQRGKPIRPVPVMTVKRFLRSRASGKAKAKEQVEAAHRLGYRSIQDHNEADALGIALGAVWLMKQR
jgi:Holliday junction resolvasome RuvABC endonuclease subunit